MAQQNKATFEGTFNDPTTGLYKTNTTGAIGSDDQRTAIENISDSVPFTLDDSYTWGFPKADTTGTNTYAATFSPAIATLVNGMKVHVKIKDASTGASTLQANATAAKKIFTNPTTQAGSGDLVDEQEYIMSYDAALDAAAGGWLMIGGGSSSGSTTIPFGTTSGTNTYTITATPTVTAYADGDLFLIEVGTGSTGASTLNFDGVGAKKVYERPERQITAGDWETGRHYLVTYDSALDAAAGGFAVVGDLSHERLTYRGGYDVSSNLFPSTGGSGAAGGLRTGDFWVATNTGTLGSTAVSNRDLIINIGGSSPGQTEGNWAINSGVASVDTKLALKENLPTEANVTLANGVVTIDYNAGDVQHMTISENKVITTISNPLVGKSILVILDGTFSMSFSTITAVVEGQYNAGEENRVFILCTKVSGGVEFRITFDNSLSNAFDVDSAAFIGLTDGATIVWAVGANELFSNRTVTIAGDRTFGAPTGMSDGTVGTCWVTASGAVRTISIPAGTSHKLKGVGDDTFKTITIPSGETYIISWQYNSALGIWVWWYVD